MSSRAEQGMAYAVLGYVSDEVARSLGSQSYGGALELRVARGSDREIVRIQPGDVAGVLHGASHGGETSVQVLLKENAKVETVSRGVAGDLFLQHIKDPITFHQPPHVAVIYVPPQKIAKIPGIVAAKLESA